MSASLATMTGGCPPSSIVTALTVSALFLINDFPTLVEPVNVTLLTYLLPVTASPAVLPFALIPGTTSTGKPASSDNSIKGIAVNGVDSADLQRKVNR